MKRRAPHLRAMGVKVTDLSVSGWVSNTASGQQLMDRVISTGLPSDAIYVLDLLGKHQASGSQRENVVRTLQGLPDTQGDLGGGAGPQHAGHGHIR